MTRKACSRIYRWSKLEGLVIVLTPFLSNRGPGFPVEDKSRASCGLNG